MQGSIVLAVVVAYEIVRRAKVRKPNARSPARCPRRSAAPIEVTA